MRLLLDANLSPRIVGRLTRAGFDARHVRDIGMAHAADDPIFDRAAADGDVVVTSDTDFTVLLAARRTSTPSVILLRHVTELRPDGQADLLIANLPTLLNELDKGAVVSLSPTRLAVRSLPIG